MLKRWKSMVRVYGALAALFALAALPGCSPPPPLDSAEYGEILTKLPEIPGAEKPYPLPELELPPDPKAETPTDEPPAEGSADAEAAGK